MDRETCEHGAPVSQICERCDLTAVERLGLAISNAGVTWTNEMREEWDKAADEIKLLRLKLREVINECGEYACENNGLKQQLAECQAQVKQAKREAVLMVANWVEPQRNIIPATGEEFAAAIRIAKELET